MTTTPTPVPQVVVITDIDIPFGRLVAIFIKWAFAAIPATIIVSIILMIVMGILGMLFGVILAYVGYNAVYAVASFPAGALADRLGRPVVYGFGLVFFAVSYLGLGSTTNTVQTQKMSLVMVGVSSARRTACRRRRRRTETATTSAHHDDSIDARGRMRAEAGAHR